MGQSESDVSFPGRSLDSDSLSVDELSSHTPLSHKDGELARRVTINGLAACGEGVGLLYVEASAA